MAQAALATFEQGQELGAATAAVRRTMVERQIRPFDVTDLPVLERFLAVPREVFLPAELAPLAYSDMAITLKDGAGKARGLLPLLVLARLLQGADIRPSEKVLDIGGCGYSAALLSGLAGEVVSLECDSALAEKAKAGLAAAGVETVRVVTGPLEKGAAGAGPFDVILVLGAVEDGLDTLFTQLSPNGRLIAITTTPVTGGQQVVRFERHAGLAAGERPLFDAAAKVLPGFEKAPAFAL